MLARISLLFGLLLAAGVAVAAPRGLIRDAEIEAALERIATPIFRAAGLAPATVHIYVVEDPTPNAFVAGGQNLFLNTGMLMRLETIDQLRAVIAHETGHIAGGHQTRRDQALRGSRGLALIGLIGGAAATMGGSADAGMAIAASTGQVAQRNMLAHSRAEEAAADQAGLRYLVAAGGDPGAMLEVLRDFRGQELLVSTRADPYAQTHPLWGERIALIEERVATLPHGEPPNAEDVYWHARMVAKLSGFLQTSKQLTRAYPEGDASESALMAHAIAYHRRPDPDRALAAVDGLIAARPDDPYYNELKGQFLLEAGRAGPAADAYRRAVGLAQDEPLILGGLGRALLNLDSPEQNAEARDVLARSARLDVANPGVLRDLALAEARLGNDGAAALATAERFVLEGRFADASRHASHAAAMLPTGSPGWKQAQDVITVARRAATEDR